MKLPERPWEQGSDHRSILGVRIDATSYAGATERVLAWAGRGESCYVCCAAVNNIMEARRSPDYRVVMDQAHLVTSDGMPLVWMLRWLGARSATRVYGPDLTSHSSKPRRMPAFRWDFTAAPARCSRAW